MRITTAISVALLSLSGNAAADVIRWTNPAGGNWDDATNWDIGRVPDVTDVAIFELESVYTVTFGSQPRFDSVDISKGEIDFELGDVAAICLGSEFGTRSITVAGAAPHNPILRLRGGLMLAKCPDSDPDTSLPEALLAVGLPSAGKPNGRLFIHDVGTYTSDLPSITLRVRVGGNGLMHLISGPFGWSQGIVDSNSVTYFVDEQASAIIDGDLTGSAIYGNGNWVINGNLDGFDNHLSFGEAFITSGTDLRTEDLYPGATTLTQPTDFGGDFIYPGTMIFKEPGNTILGFSLDRTHLIIEYQDVPEIAWHVEDLWVFNPKISVHAATATGFPIPPSAITLLEGSTGNSVGLETGTLELPFASDSELVTVRVQGQTKIWLQMAEPGWCRADQDFNGVLNFFDIVAFINHYNNGEPWAQMNEEQRLNFFDVADYIALFNAGCP